MMAGSISKRCLNDGRWRYKLVLWTPGGSRMEYWNTEEGTNSLYFPLGMLGIAAGIGKSTTHRWLDRAIAEAKEEDT